MAADAERLDFTSAHFDALFALTSGRAVPPVPDAKPLDNLSRCRYLLEPDHPDYLPPEMMRRKRPAPGTSGVHGETGDAQAGAKKEADAASGEDDTPHLY